MQGLAQVLASLNLSEHLAVAVEWCVMKGADSVHDLQGGAYAEQLAKKLNLPEIKAHTLVKAINP